MFVSYKYLNVETRWRRNRWTWSTPLSPNQEYTFRHRSTCRIPAESEQEYLNTRKEYIEPSKTQ